MVCNFTFKCFHPSKYRSVLCDLWVAVTIKDLNLSLKSTSFWPLQSGRQCCLHFRHDCGKWAGLFPSHFLDNESPHRESAHPAGLDKYAGVWRLRECYECSRHDGNFGKFAGIVVKLMSWCLVVPSHYLLHFLFITIKPCQTGFISGNVKIYLHFLPFLDTEMISMG